MTRSSDLVMVERGVLERIEFSNKGYCPACDGWMVDEWRGATPGKHTPTCELAKAISALQSVEGGVQGSIATKQATDETAASVLSEPPEAWADCETCGGEGAINRTIHVYENGCGFSHPDVEIIPCTDCMGTGGAIVGATSTYCDICGGDCSSANPPVFNCPLAKQESCPESAPRTETAIVTALRDCRRVLAMMIDPESIKSTSVIHAFAAATAAEAKARTALSGVTNSAPASRASHNSGERDPSVMPDCPGADTKSDGGAA